MSQSPAKELTLQIHSGWRIIAFESFEEDRAMRVVERAARSCERQIHIWSVAAGLGASGQGAGSLDAGLQAMAQVSEPAIFVALDPQRHLDASAVRRMRDWLVLMGKRKQSLVLLGPSIDLPIELHREVGHVRLPLPRVDELERLFRMVVDPGDDLHAADILDSAVRAALGLTAAEAVRVLRKAVSLAGGLDESVPRYVVEEKREALRRTPALTFCDVHEGLADVGGLGELKRWLRDRKRAFSEEAEQFGLPAPRGLLLLGVQGCGKSLCAKAVAQEWQFPLLRLDMAAVFSGGGQSPEATIREATSVAESIAPAVLWVDEIEKGFSAAGASGESNRVFGSFLTWLAEKRAPVFVAATANDVKSLPPELLRRGRFDELFFVDLPTLEERVEIFGIHLARRGRDSKQFQLETLAVESERLSGAEIEQVVSAALYMAFAEDRDLTDVDLMSAINETIPLYDTYEDRIKELRDWTRDRARTASVDARMVDLFQRR